MFPSDRIADQIRLVPKGKQIHAQTILRRHDVERATGLPRSTIYEKVSKGPNSPKPSS